MTKHLDEIRGRRPLDPEARARVDATKRAMRLQVALAEKPPLAAGWVRR